MTGEFFVDTSAWYPLVVGSHHDHPRVAEVLRRLIAQRTRVVTTNLIVAETHALLLRRHGRDTALEFVRTVGEEPNLVVSSTPEIEDRAIADWLEPYDDKNFSFTDAVSFAVMVSRGIDDALTLDRHFAVAGFHMLPGVIP